MINYKILLKENQFPASSIQVIEGNLGFDNPCQKLLPHPCNALVFNYGDLSEYSVDGINFTKLPSIYLASYYLTEKMLFHESW
jgi:hypothetical protein